MLPSVVSLKTFLLKLRSSEIICILEEFFREENPMKLITYASPLLTLKFFFFLGTWVSQSVKRFTLDNGSGHDLTVGGMELCIRLWADIKKPAWDICSPFFLPLPHSSAGTLMLSLSIKK